MDKRSLNYNHPIILPGSTTHIGLGTAFHYGLSAGILGVAAMTLGILAAGIRATMAYNGIAGPFASFLFTGVRLLIDQTLENATGVGALPWLWPASEQVLDVLHKMVYAFVTGYFVDKWVVGYTWK
ncbi:hypothetical protein HK097_003168 [Rhizophlyctis rosea]|uniref:Uncharacterized protein n=1 Tax=Rhizophlyctis rosea TaxID=64517 RepID=A0AAD5X7J6_9FUNG|nr:hypothetical protein HK097_003168 [Rhizophlyctis rosea]